MINTQLKLLFIDIPKTGSTSLKCFIVREFSEFIWLGNSHPSWMGLFCNKNRSYSINQFQKAQMNFKVRHEPLVSCFLHIEDIKDYFTFTVVRNPFDRFVSAFIEIMMFNRHNVPQFSADHSSTRHDNLPDSWHAYPHHHLNRHYLELEKKEEEKNIALEKHQSKLIFNQLNRIASKGGFNNTGVCNVPLHFWPQYIFTDLTLPSPLNIIFLKHEYLKQDFPIFKRELSNFTGINVVDTELPYIDPVATIIYSYHNPGGVNTIDFKSNEEKEIHPNPKLNEAFAERYPTFDSYYSDYLEEKKEIKARWLPTLEVNCSLIEHLYSEDYRKFNYKQQIINNSTEQ
jgi:hypothetical protein